MSLCSQSAVQVLLLVLKTSKHSPYLEEGSLHFTSQGLLLHNGFKERSFPKGTQEQTLIEAEQRHVV